VCSSPLVYSRQRPLLSKSDHKRFVHFLLLDSGSHTVTIEVANSAGLTQKIDRTVQTVKVGDSEFLDQFDLSAATASIIEGTLLLKDVKIRDKASQQTTQVTVGYVWEPSCQCFVAQPGCGNGTIESGEECDGSALDGESCSSFGLSAGELACQPPCTDDDDCVLPCFFELKDCASGPAIYVTGDVINAIKTGDGPFAVAAVPVPSSSP
jgi:hypothetical protein